MIKIKNLICVFLLLFLVLQNVNSVNLVKADDTASNGYGYIYIYHKDVDTDEYVKSNLTVPIKLDSEGKGSYTFNVDAVSNYSYSYSTINENKTIQKTITVQVTSANTPDNPVNVVEYYKSNSTVFTVTTHGRIVNPDGHQENFGDSSQSVQVINNNPVTVSTKAPTPSNTAWKFMYATIGLDGAHINSKSVDVTVSDSNVDVYYWYSADSTGTADVTITEGDHILDPKTMQVVDETDGKDYFARNDFSETIEGSKMVTVKSPSMGASKPGYKLYFAVVEHQQGNPNSALSDYVDKQYSTQFDTNISTESGHWYVHFYWVPVDTPPPGAEKPPSGSLSFNPNESPWTNQGKISNGKGSYDIDVQYNGVNPTTGKGTVTYHHHEEKTGTTGNPPHDYTYYVDYDHNNQFDVAYSLDHIQISGDSNSYIKGAGGTASITKEGANLKLHGEGFWGQAQYLEPSAPDGNDTKTGEQIPAPDNPTGDSGVYKIDWTDPSINFSMSNGTGNITYSDNLSGLKEVQYAWTFGNNPSSAEYQTIYENGYTEGDRSSEAYSKQVQKPVGDNLYMNVRSVDEAGNEITRVFGPYEDQIKLENFRVTDVHDPNWENIFYKDSSDKLSNPNERPALSQKTDREFKVNELPLDSDSNPYKISIKKGYGFNFTLDSEYLYRDYDKIEITPTFYYWDGSKRVQVDGYYNNNNKYVKIGSQQDNFYVSIDSNLFSSRTDNVNIGSYSKLTLSKDVRTVEGSPYYNGWQGKIQYSDGKIQHWYGFYYVPDNTIFVEKDKELRSENILKDNYIIINFQIKAYKNGAETNGSSQTFTYVPGQWTAEGGPKSSKYQSGDVIVYTNKYSVLDNFHSVVTN